MIRWLQLKQRIHLEISHDFAFARRRLKTSVFVELLNFWLMFHNFNQNCFIQFQIRIKLTEGEGDGLFSIFEIENL